MRLNLKPLIDSFKTPVRAAALGWFCCLWAFFSPQLSMAAGVIQDSIEQAVKLRKSGELCDSLYMLQRLRIKEPHNVRVHLELVLGYLKAKQYDDADNTLEALYALSPKMKDNKKLKKLDAVIFRARQNEQIALGLESNERTLLDGQTHKFDFEVTAYKGVEELTSEFSYLEITEFEDYFQIERKNDHQTSKYYYSGARLKGEYRYTPNDSFDLFGRQTYSFVSNRLTYFYKEADTLVDADFGYTSLDSSWFVIQPEHWAFNAKIQGKWHNYKGSRSLTEIKTDISLSRLIYGARVKVGLSHNENTLDSDYVQDTFDADYAIIEQTTRLVTPYVSVSYRFSPDFLWSAGIYQRNIHASNYLLEGRVINYRSTVKYDVTENFELHLSYQHNDLRYDYFNVDGCFDIDSFECFNSGELKRTFTLGSGYNLSEHWQIGLNAMYMDKKQDNDFGQDQWKRLEAFVKYRF